MSYFKQLILILFIGVSAYVSAQTAQQADTLFKAKNYTQAREAYQKLLKSKPRNDLYNFRVGVCAFELKNTDEALSYFLKTSEKFPLKYYYLGEIYFDSYQFEESVKAFNTYLENFNPLDNLISSAQKKKKQAELGMKFLKRVEDVVVVDSIVVNKSNFLKSLHLSPDLGSFKQHHYLKPDGSSGDNAEYITQRGDRKYFSDTINGQSDLFSSFKLLDAWTSAEKLSDINSSDNENYPFLMLDGVTLYYASDGESSMGGYDIFITRFDASTNKYLPSENVGMPFNSPFNDYLIVIDDIHRKGWFVSDRYQPEEKVAIYQFIPNEQTKIIHSENSDSLIRIAQVRQVVKSEKNQTATSSVVAVDKSRKTIGKQIFINDGIIYYDTTEFKSIEAKVAFKALEKMEFEISKTKSDIDKARTEYATTTDENTKLATGTLILSLEAKLRELEPQVKVLAMRMRNEEIKFLQKNP